jgi:hypothetical protein
VGSITKIIREHKVIVKHRPHFGNAIDRSRSRALHDVKTCQKFSGETQAKQEGSIMESEMAAVLLLDEKMCFIRLSPDTLQNFWQLITRSQPMEVLYSSLWQGVESEIHVSAFAAEVFPWKTLDSPLGAPS